MRWWHNPRPSQWRRWLRAGVLVAVCGGGLWGGTVAAPAGPPATPLASVPLPETLTDLLRELRARQLGPATEAESRAAACQVLLDVFGTGGTVVGLDPAQGEAEVGGSSSGLGMVAAVGGRYGYLEVRSVDPGLQAALTAARNRLPQRPDGGLVIDVREAAGDGVQEAQEAVAAIAQWHWPIVVLVGPRTRAAAEVFGKALREQAGAVLLGEPTRGLPYPLRPVTLGGGLQVLLPDVPPGARPEPVVPDVRAAAATVPGQPRDQASGKARGVAEGLNDAGVRQAMDLLTAIATFRQKPF